MDPGLKLVFAVIKQAELARALGVSPQAIDQWGRVPTRHIIEIERITGIDRSRLRPELYRKRA